MLQTFKTKLTHKERMSESVYIFRFICRDPDTLQFEAGQYMIVKIPQPDGEFKTRLYSVLNTPNQKNSFDLLAKIIPGGVGSEYLMTKQMGDEVIFDGPAGVFTLKEEDRHKGRHKVFIATGTGVAPVHSMINTHLPHHPEERFVLLWGTPTRREVYFIDTWKKLEGTYPNFRFAVFISREQSLSDEEKKHFVLGRVNKGIDALTSAFGIPTGGNIANFDIYVAGDRFILDSLKAYLLAKGADPGHLVLEKFV